MDFKFLLVFLFLAFSAVISLGNAASVKGGPLGEFEVEGSEAPVGDKDTRCGGGKGKPGKGAPAKEKEDEKESKFEKIKESIFEKIKGKKW